MDAEKRTTKATAKRNPIRALVVCMFVRNCKTCLRRLRPLPKEFNSIFCGEGSGISKTRLRRFGRNIPGLRAGHFQLPLVDAIAAGRKQHVKVPTSESEVRDLSVRSRNNALHSAGL